MWNGLGLNPLPEDFDWTLVAGNLTRALKGYVNRTPELRDQLLVALIDRQTEFQARLAGPDPGFDLPGYREFLRRKCGLLQLSAMHTSAYDRRIGLWSVFVPQSARESIPVRDLPRDLLRRWAARQELARGWKDDPEVRKMLAGHS